MRMTAAPQIPNAITADTLTNLDIPASLPTGHITTFYGLIDEPSTFSEYAILFNFSGADKTQFRINSSRSGFDYFYYGNNYLAQCSPVGNKTKKLEMKKSSRIYTLTFEDETTMDSTYVNFAWANRTAPIRLYLRPHFKVSRITEVDSSDILIHDLLPAEQGGEVGMLDVVTNVFYGDTTGNAYLTTI